MSQPDLNSKQRKGLRASLAVAAASGLGAVTLMLPGSLAYADPVPPPPPAPGTEAPAPPPADPNAPPPPPADPNAPPPPPADPNAPPPPPADPNAPPPRPADPNAPPADPNAPPADPEAPPAPEPGRVDNAAGGFSYVVPGGWVVGDASRLNYGQALLTKEAPPVAPGEPAPAATDTSILLGRLDLKLFAGAEPDNEKAAVRLASDMGEFFMPFAGTRLNQETVPLDANGMPGSASFYEVKFTDTTKPDGQIWAGVVGDAAANAPRGQRNERWFVVWLGTSNDPVDKEAAQALANSIRPWTPPPAPAAPPADPNAPAPAPADPNAPPPPPADPNAPAPAPADPNAPAPVPGRSEVGVPVPVETPVPEMTPPA
ncbi:alanine and proline-rich secreted protein Apa [Mycolicibacterium sp.]|uniref:alanine and proline-rich secreted protein Apa n=1 Tax=Mycolicibacterium sp. TaxID=2320850 RepID=UPI00355E2833